MFPSFGTVNLQNFDKFFHFYELNIALPVEVFQVYKFEKNKTLF